MRRIPTRANSYRKKFPVVLRKKRLAKQLTQAELASTVDCDKALIVRWESGNVLPSTYGLVKLSLALNTTPNELLGFKDAKG